jgi:hypothetical protein
MKSRRVYDQPTRDDYVVHPGLGLSSVRTDHADGSATFAVMVVVPGYRGLSLDTGDTITRVGGSFHLNSHGPAPVRSNLEGALRVYASRARHTIQPILTATAA